MKRNLYTMAMAISAILACNAACAQGLAVNATGSAAAASAIVDMASTTKGMLAPRMLAAEKTAISAPATGLLIYQTDGTPGFYYYNGTAWAAISGAAAGWGLAGNAGTVATTSFIGTTDSVALKLRVNNNLAGELNPGTFNTAYGYKAGQAMTTGTSNTATGHQGLTANTIGNYNTATGYRAMAATTTGSSNTAVGYSSLASNLTGAYNTAMGSGSLFANLGSFNTAYGINSLTHNTTGSKNTATGVEALGFNTTGTENTAYGYGSLASNVASLGNTASGYYSLFANTSSNNTGYGSRSLMSNTTGAANCASGAYSMYQNTTGGSNTAIGYFSMQSNLAGSYNTAVGVQSLYTNDSGSGNTALGNQALYYNKADENTAFGSRSLIANTTGTGNTAAGFESLSSNITGTNNTAIGNSCMDNSLGSNNTAIGYNAMAGNTTGGSNTAIGASANVTGTALTNATALGYNARATASNMVRIGSATVTSINGAVAFTVVSDGRFKSNVQERVPGLAFIMKLRPVTYNLDVRKIDRYTGMADSMMQNQAASYDKAEAIVRTGLIAQEVEKAAKEAGYDFDGVHKPQNDKDPYGIAYAEFTVPLVKAVQEQQAVITELKQANATLLRQMDALTQRLNALEQTTPKNIH